MQRRSPDNRPSDRNSAQGLSRRGFISATTLAALGLTTFEINALTLSAEAAVGGYLRPCGNVFISDSWQGHKNRTPSSKEPGTDYSVPIGTPVRAVTSGTIAYVKGDPSGPMGRVVGMRHDDGAYTRHLHLSSIQVAVNARVARGDRIALSGASANGSERGVGAHVHTSMWLSDISDTSATVDFERYVGGSANPTPAPTTEGNISIQLWLYTPNNSLMLIDHMNMTIRNLGNVASIERDHFAAGGAYRTIGEPQWTNTFKNFKYITVPNVVNQP